MTVSKPRKHLFTPDKAAVVVSRNCTSAGRKQCLSVSGAVTAEANGCKVRPDKTWPSLSAAPKWN